MPLKKKRNRTKEREADILITAIGKPNFIKAENVKKDAVIIDVGINRLETGKIVGDVDFEEVSKKSKLYHTGTRGSRANDNSNAHKQCNKGN